MAECVSNKIDSNITGLALAEEVCLKELPVAGPAVAASGTLTLLTQPAVNDTMVVDGVTYTFVSTAPTGDQIQIGANAGATATAIATKLDGDADIGAVAVGNVVTITATTAGEAGNAKGTFSTSPAIDFSGATLSGGKDVTTDPVWRNREPNSYADFGGENTTVARTPIDPTRQNKKGTVTDLDASGGFNEDITQNNMVWPLQGFFFADARQLGATQPLNGPQVVMTSAATDGYLAAAGLGVFAINDLVKATGWGVPGNNGLKTATGVAAGKVTVAQVLTAEAAPPATAKLEVVGKQFAAADIAVVMTGNVAGLSAVAADFTTVPGLIPGSWIFLGGDAVANRFANNVGFARVNTVAAKLVTFDEVTWTPVAEAGTGKTIQIFQGIHLRNEQIPALIKRRSYSIERTLGEGPNGTQAEYLEGAIANEFTLNIPSADKLNADLTYVACDNTFRSGDPGDEIKAGTRLASLGEDAFNTSSDILRLKLHVHNAMTSTPKPLFAYVTEGTLAINNGVTPNKAVGVLGAFDASSGNFSVTGSVTAYFSTVEACRAVRNNADVGFSLIAGARGAGFIWDLPLLSLGGGRINVEANAPITIPLESNGARNKFGFTLSYTTFPYLPTVAMPD